MSMYASSTVIGYSGIFVTREGAGGWSYSGLSETRRVASPGNTLGSMSINDQWLILLNDMSREVRVDENTMLDFSGIVGGLSDPILLIIFPRRDNFFSSDREANCRMEWIDSKPLYSSISSWIVLDIGHGSDVNSFPETDNDRNDGNCFETAAT